MSPTKKNKRRNSTNKRKNTKKSQFGGHRHENVKHYHFQHIIYS